MVTNVPASLIDLLKNIQKEFLWSGKKTKIKHDTIRNEYVNGGLKSVDIISKIVSSQCSSIRRLFDNNFHQWKIIPIALIDKHLNKNFKFHFNLSFDIRSLEKFPKYYKEMFNNWAKHLLSPVTLPSAIVSQCIWFNKKIQIDKKSVYFSSFAENGLNFVGQLFDGNGKLISWEVLKTQFNLLDRNKFQWLQIIHAIPIEWKNSLSTFQGNLKNLLVQDLNLIKKSHVYCLSRLDSKELYNLQITLKFIKPTSQYYYETSLNQTDIDWKRIYIIPRIVTIDTKLRNFQYKILSNVLYLNKMLLKFGISKDRSCSFFNIEEETTIHIFYGCVHVQNIWNELRAYLIQDLVIPDLSPQSAIFGYVEIQQDFKIINHLLLIFKLFVYKSRDEKYLNFHRLKNKIAKVKNIEETITYNNPGEKEKFLKKWKKKVIKKFN